MIETPALFPRPTIFRRRAAGKSFCALESSVGGMIKARPIDERRMINRIYGTGGTTSDIVVEKMNRNMYVL